MRLLSHNMLVCNVKGCGSNNFPLIIKGDAKKEESEFNPDFMKHIVDKLDWNGLVLACKDLNITIPETIPPNAKEDPTFLKSLHDVIIDTHVNDGSLTCRNCGRVYPIGNGIPNMLLTEDEV